MKILSFYCLINQFITSLQIHFCRKIAKNIFYFRIFFLFLQKLNFKLYTMHNKRKSRQEKIKEASLFRAMQENLPVEATKTLVQPLGITMLQGDFSQLKTNIMVELMDNFQDKMNDQLVNPNKQLQLFDNNDIPLVRIPLKDLEIRTDQYGELDVIVDELLSQRYETEVVENGVVMKKYYPLFSMISVPKKPIVGKLDKDGNIQYKRTGYIEIQFNKEIGLKALTIDKQFTKYIKGVTRNRKCRHTPRIYLFISSYKDIGQWKVNYKGFHKLMGFTIVKQKGEELVEEVILYPNFSDIKRRVIEPAMKELKKLGEINKSDCYFDYEPVYSGHKKTGNPDYLIFHVHKTSLGDMMTYKNQLDKDEIELQNFLRSEFNISKKDSQELISRLTEENRNMFRVKVIELKTYICDVSHNVRNVKTYALTSLKAFLDEFESKKEKTPSSNMKEDIRTEDVETRAVITKEQTESWSRFLAVVKEGVSEEEYNNWFKYIELFEETDSMVTVKVPTPFFRDWMGNQFKDIVDKALSTVYGQETSIRFVC